MLKNYSKTGISVLSAIIFSFIFIQPAFAANFTVTKIADTNDGVCDADCSLREAIATANVSPGTDTIIIPAGTYTLSIAGTGEDINTTGDLDITDDLTISGAGTSTTILDGADIDRVLEVRPGVTVQINAVTIQNGKPNGSGGGVLNRGTLTLTNSLVTSNTGLDFGGGIFNADTLTITDSTVDNNETTGFNLSGGGGGIFTQGVLTATRTTVSNNMTLGRGGGIYNLDQTLTMTNGTISTNTALNGGGIFNRSGTANLTHNTITNNTATDNGGGVWNFGGIMTFANTIVSSNIATTASDDCAGGTTSLGYNLASDASCGFGGTGDLNSTNPLLGPLTNNGGPTETHALLPGSPAIDTVPVASCIIITDQRSVFRPQGPDCDIGAFELEPILPLECSGNISDYNLIQGTNGNDNLIGTSKKDLIFGYGGNDRIKGNSTNDCLVGASGSDDIDGGSGDDILLGGEGNDNMNGGSGNDNLMGSLGDDDMKGSSGSDTIDGQAGANDKANGGTAIDTCVAETETNCEI